MSSIILFLLEGRELLKDLMMMLLPAAVAALYDAPSLS